MAIIHWEERCKLVAMGVIERKPDSLDRYRLQLSLTPKGKGVTQEARELIPTVLAKRYSPLPTAGTRRAVDALQAVAEQLEQQNA